jgi:4-hydroxy-3-methylbut-2-en-1-yl diphosphate reductase
VRPGLLVLAPLRVEALALRAGLPRATAVMRTGMGRERALAIVERARAVDAHAVVVSGVCGAVDPSLRAGDVVVATELRAPDGSVYACNGSETLARKLETAGLCVRTGTIASVEHIAGREARERLSGQAIAVDMESVWLSGAQGDGPFSVARVVVDTASRALLDPRTVMAAIRALFTLRRVGSALSDWARLLECNLPMETP